MELREFIKATLTDIMQGVLDAQAEWTASGQLGVIAPAAHAVAEKHFREVAFDVAVTAENSTVEKAGGGIKVWGVGIGGEISGNVASSSVSRIQFAIPVAVPMIVVKDIPGAPQPLTPPPSMIPKP